MSDRAAEVAFYVLLLVLPVAALVARRPPPGRTLWMILAWAGIFTVGVAIASQRDRVAAWFADRTIEGSETRVEMAADGHFWVNATIDGVSRRMLVDSGATTTALSRATADAARLAENSPFPVVLDTANGRITARTATVGRIVIGTLVARDVSVVVSPAFGDTDVIGMNVLERLAGWRIEGRTLILTPPNQSSSFT